MTSVRQATGMLVWYLREVLGEHDYDRYIAYQRREDPGAPLLSRREFERRRMEERYASSRPRCC
jgi:uncharacterized short protein YbdD (DUF466 family)